MYVDANCSQSGKLTQKLVLLKKFAQLSYANYQSLLEGSPTSKKWSSANPSKKLKFEDTTLETQIPAHRPPRTQVYLKAIVKTQGEEIYG